MPTSKPLSLTDSSQCDPSAVIGTESKQLSLIETDQPIPSQLLDIYQKLPLSANSGQSTTMQEKADLHSLSTKRSSRIVSKEKAVTWYNGILGTVTILKKSKFASKSRELAILDKYTMSEETIVVLTPNLLKKRYELRYRESFGHISRTLNVQRVVDRKSPVFKMACAGDIAGMYSAFCDGRASPDIVDTSGRGLLHVSNLSRSPRLCHQRFMFYSIQHVIISWRHVSGSLIMG